MTDSKPSPSSGNPSPEPSAESLAEAQATIERYWPESHLYSPGRGKLRDYVALALDAAKRSSRREALGQAVDLVESERVWQRRDLLKALRALMEAE